MLARFLAVTSALFFVACATSATPADEAASEADVVAGAAMTAAPTDPCKATLVFLQKDAYRGGGRSSELWPPHTTTVLEVTCTTASGPKTIAPFQFNHGTKPGTKDEQGNEVLTRVAMDERVTTTSAPWSEMQKLVASYGSCECEAGTFLSLDEINATAEGLFAKFASLLTCQDPHPAILAAIREKRFAEVRQMLLGCRVKDGASPTDLEALIAQVGAEVKSAYADHHVCNNDAVLQADLFKRFRESRDARGCDARSAVCSGLKLFYRPAIEVD